MNTSKLNRRNFIKKTSLSTGSLMALPLLTLADNSTNSTTEDNLNVIGPKEGFSPQVGTLVSMMNWMRDTILGPVKGMTIKDLDYLHDEKSNTIGAMLLHLAATERYYQLHTFGNIKWGRWSKAEKETWDTAMNLGDAGRAEIKGHDLDFYLEKLETVRAQTLKQFAERDDEWLLAVDKDWYWGPTNNYCKWFHVCEHESNHNGQIKYIKSRLHSNGK